MRVLVVAEQLRRPVEGGIGTYIRGLVGGLSAAGADVTLWASRPPPVVRGPKAGAGGSDPLLALGRVVTSPLPSRALVLAWDRGACRPPRGPAADIVHAGSLAVPPAGAVPLSVMVHDLAWRRFPEAYPVRGRRWHEAAVGRAVTRAALLIVPSTTVADDLLAAGAPGSRVEVVEEGCDHLPPPDDVGTDKLLAGLGVDGEFLLTVSTLEPRKNLLRLLDAYRQARPRLPEPWPLVVVGPAGWGPAVPPSPGVVLAGHTGGAVLAGLYGRARVMAYVPLAEGFGLPVVEAMSAGVPVVATPVPSAGGAALEVDALDTAAMADALVRAATDDGLRSDLVVAGRARAAGLTWAAAARRHLELWASIAP